jgi:hypothetical protein
MVNINVIFILLKFKLTYKKIIVKGNRNYFFGESKMCRGDKSVRTSLEVVPKLFPVVLELFPRCPGKYLSHWVSLTARAQLCKAKKCSLVTQ